jgi:signal transduction histidine kinase
MRYITFDLQYFLPILLLACLILGKNERMYAQVDAYVNFSDEYLLGLDKDTLLLYESQSRISAEIKQTLRIHDILIKKAKISKIPTELYDSYILKAKQYLTYNLHEKALNYFDSAALVIKPINKKTYTSALIDRAIIFQEIHKYNEARDIYINILKDFPFTKDTLHKHISLCNLGVLFEEIGDYDNAIRYYSEALKEVEAEKNNSYVCTYLSNLSEAYKGNKQPNQALIYIERAYTIAVSSNDLELKNIVLINYAHVLSDLSRFNESYTKLEEASNFCVGEYAKRYFNNISIAKAEILLKQNNIAGAKQVLTESYGRLQNISNKAKITYHLGAIYYAEKADAKAKFFLLECQQIAEQNSIFDYAEKAHRLLFAIYDNEKNAERALFHLKAANNIRDTMLSIENAEQISALQFKFDLEQSESKLKTSELNASRNLMLLGTLAAMFVFATMFYIMRLRSKNYHNLKIKNALIESQKHELEEKNAALEIQKKKLEESNILLKQFSYAVAHDLKEPLRTISNFSSIIQKKYKPLLPDEANEYFNYVTSGAKKMTAMLEGLLQYAIVSTKIEEKEVLELKEVINDVTLSLNKKINDCEAAIICDDKLPKVNMSRIHATQLFQNLTSNALKFVEQKPIIEIHSKVINNQALISIKDNGIGIDKESGAKLFNLFHRIHKDSSRFEGTGVGLALCKNIVEKYHGKIWFESMPNNGTTFFIQLPLAA